MVISKKKYLPSSIPVITSGNSEIDEITMFTSDIIFRDFAVKASLMYDVRRMAVKLLQ